MKQKIKDAFLPVLNKARCLNKRIVGNIELANMLIDALPHDVQIAIERATPKKPCGTVKNLYLIEGYCPTCNTVVANDWAIICPRCGQHLDWSR